MKKIGLLGSLLFAFLLIFGVSNFLGAPVSAQAVSVRVGQDFVSNADDALAEFPVFDIVDNTVTITDGVDGKNLIRATDS